MVDSIARSLLIVLVVSLAALVVSPATTRADGHWPPTCGTKGPFNFDTYEARNHVADYGLAINYAVQGSAVPEPYQTWTGDWINVAYRGLEKGRRGYRASESRAERIPPSVYKSIAWVEANWNNAVGSVPYGGVGQVLTSFDCGYGLGQVTTGMANTTGNASARQAVIGTHFLFNIAEGVNILADKWNSAPNFRPVAGEGNPAVLEDWYYAIWSYNGFAFSNHPLYPGRDIWRGEVYHCYNPAAPPESFWWGYGDYTYPERVYGCMRYPPLRNNVPMYPAVSFQMPQYKEAGSPVAIAFQPSAFTSCQSIGFSGGCPAMDYPTPVKSVDPTPRATASVPFLGTPSLSYSGPTTVNITVSGSESVSGAGSVVVRNLGTYIAPFRIHTSHPWIVVHHPGESWRRLQGSIAVGADVPVVTSSGTQAGYNSSLVITVDVASLPSSVSQGTVWLEPLIPGSGPAFRINVTAARGAYALPIKAVVPAVSADK